MQAVSKKILVFFLVFLLAGCFVPKKVPHTADEQRCELKTQQLKLVMSEKAYFPSGARCSGDECLVVLAVMAAIPVGSALVSGSIVVVGNTAHWLEYQGRCDQGFLAQVKIAFIDTLKKTGEILQVSDDILKLK
jgi:hypothetical protein